MNQGVDMNATDETYTDDNTGLEIGSVFTEHNGVGVVWTFRTAAGTSATLAYQTRKAAFFGLMRVAYGRDELIKVRNAKTVAAANISKGAAHVVQSAKRGFSGRGFAGRVLGIVTSVRTEGNFVYLTFDDFIELCFEADDQLMIVE